MTYLVWSNAYDDFTDFGSMWIHQKLKSKYFVNETLSSLQIKKTIIKCYIFYRRLTHYLMSFYIQSVHGISSTWMNLSSILKTQYGAKLKLKLYEEKNIFFFLVTRNHPRCSIKRVFFKISQNSQENTCVVFPFLIIKKEIPIQVFCCKFCKISKSTTGRLLLTWI